MLKKNQTYKKKINRSQKNLKMKINKKKSIRKTRLIKKKSKRNKNSRSNLRGGEWQPYPTLNNKKYYLRGGEWPFADN